MLLHIRTRHAQIEPQQPKVNSRKRRLRKVKGRQQVCINSGKLVTLGMFLRLPL